MKFHNETEQAANDLVFLSLSRPPRQTNDEFYVFALFRRLKPWMKSISTLLDQRRETNEKAVKETEKVCGVSTTTATLRVLKHKLFWLSNKFNIIDDCFDQ